MGLARRPRYLVRPRKHVICAYLRQFASGPSIACRAIGPENRRGHSRRKRSVQVCRQQRAIVGIVPQRAARTMRSIAWLDYFNWTERVAFGSKGAAVLAVFASASRFAGKRNCSAPICERPNAVEAVIPGICIMLRCQHPHDDP